MLTLYVSLDVDLFVFACVVYMREFGIEFLFENTFRTNHTQLILKPKCLKFAAQPEPHTLFTDDSLMCFEKKSTKTLYLFTFFSFSRLVSLYSPCFAPSPLRLFCLGFEKIYSGRNYINAVRLVCACIRVLFTDCELNENRRQTRKTQRVIEGERNQKTTRRNTNLSSDRDPNGAK